MRSAASRRSRERIVLARSEPREQRGGQHRQRHAAIDRLLQRPAPFAGILDVAFELPTGRGSSASARAVSSSSHDRTTLPCIQRSATAGEIDAGSRSRASARSLRRRPASARTRCRCESSSRSGRRRGRRRAGSRCSGASVRKIGSRRAADVGVAADHQAVAFLRGPRCRRSCRRRRSECLSRRALARAAHRRESCVLPPSMIDVAGREQIGRARRRSIRSGRRPAPSPRRRVARRALDQRLERGRAGRADVGRVATASALRSSATTRGRRA